MLERNIKNNKCFLLQFLLWHPFVAFLCFAHSMHAAGRCERCYDESATL
jgi:hypothetical protein